MSGMTIIVKNVVRFISAAIMLFAAYLMVHGETIPGGGYAGGIILASAFILMMLAFGKKVMANKLAVNAVLACEAAAALVFLVLVAAGMFYGNPLFDLFPSGERSIGLINLADIVLGAAVALAIYAAFLVLVDHKIRMEK